MSYDEITIEGGRIYFQGFKIAAIYKDIPATVRSEFEESLEKLRPEEFEDE